MSAITRIGVLTGGGDAPGLNAVIRAVVKTAANSGIETVGIEDSFDGLHRAGPSRVLTPRDVTGILRLGGTILGTRQPRQPVRRSRSTRPTAPRDYADRVRRDVPAAGARRARRASAATARWRSRTSSARRACRSSACRRRSTTTSSARPTASASTPPSPSPPTRSIGCTRPPRRTSASWSSR